MPLAASGDTATFQQVYLGDAQIVSGRAMDTVGKLLDPIAVTRDTIKSTVIRDGFVTVDGLCAGSYADACEKSGIP